MRRALACALLPGAVLALAASACGDREKPNGLPRAFDDLAPRQDTAGRRGGKLTLLAAGDVDSLDPAVAYYQFSYQVLFASQRPLYQYAPDQTAQPTPDLADGPPKITDGGRTVTVRLRPGVRFSPPVNREVRSGDVKYALERAFSENVPAPYAGGYFGTIEGAPEPQAGPYREISGITTPDARTLVIRLSKPTGGLVAAALVLPVTAPVPKEYAQRFDRQSPSTYAQHQVFTGPYRIPAGRDGTLTGYEPKRRIRLVRNPSWDPRTDFRPAHLDEIDVREGNEDTVAASRRVLRGSAMATGDYPVPPGVLRQAAERQPAQVELPPSGGLRYLSFNTRVEPFADPDVRKAVIAGLDRDALRLTRGGPALGDVPTHFLPPEVPGFEQAGGARGFGLDYLAHPKGDPQVAAKYFRAAGFSSGRYEGRDEVVFVGDNDAPGSKTAQVAADQLRRMGLRLKTRLAPHEAAVAKLCGTPSQRVAVCASGGWQKDFNDAQTLLDPTFKGANISPQRNVNHAMLNVPAIDSAMDRAQELSDPAARAKAWAQVDRMVMEQAPVGPYVWDKSPTARSADVKGVVNRFNAAWDLSFTSLR